MERSWAISAKRLKGCTLRKTFPNTMVFNITHEPTYKSYIERSPHPTCWLIRWWWLYHISRTAQIMTAPMKYHIMLFRTAVNSQNNVCWEHISIAVVSLYSAPQNQNHYDQTVFRRPSFTCWYNGMKLAGSLKGLHDPFNSTRVDRVSHSDS